MKMTKDEILGIVAIKFCNGCSWLNPLWLENGPHGCSNNHCPYKTTYLELEKHFEKADKEVKNG